MWLGYFTLKPPILSVGEGREAVLASSFCLILTLCSAYIGQYSQLMPSSLRQLVVGSSVSFFYGVGLLWGGRPTLEFPSQGDLTGAGFVILLAACRKGTVMN